MSTTCLTGLPGARLQGRGSALTHLLPIFGGLLLTLPGCGGENLFQAPAASSRDRVPPIVRMVTPERDSRVAVGDSVLVQVEIEDNAGIEVVELFGFARRGNPVLGTDTTVERFVPRLVDLSALRPQPRDTSISRYLRATDEQLAEDSVFLVVNVQDVGGNVGTDTLRIRIGGPRIHILSPAPGASVRAGADLKVRITADDPEFRFLTVRLNAKGAVDHETVLGFEPPRSSLDTILPVPVPATTTPGELRLQASVRNTVNDSTSSQPVLVKLLPPLDDLSPPAVRFAIRTPERAERTDTLAITVTGSDDTRIDQVGVVVLPIHRRTTSTDTLWTLSLTHPADSATFRFSLEELGLPIPTDTSTLRIEVTAFAVDGAGNCATATVPNTWLRDICVSNGPVIGPRSGARYELLVVRGQTIPLGPGDRIADMTADAQNLFLSNIARNRLEVLPIGQSRFAEPVPVGSMPWGLAFNRERTRLYVANSGGTNISVVSPSARAEIDRIHTPNVKLYDVAYRARMIADPEAPEDSVEALFPTSVVLHDYSDRPQYIGVTQNENIVFSTVPTSAAANGTVRVYRRAQARLEIVTEYAEERPAGKLIILNADSAFLVTATRDDLLRVCPRNRSRDPARDLELPKRCFTGSINLVEREIADAGYDTKFLYNYSIDELGLADTTFIAVSGDHSTVAVGEGAREDGRIITLTDVAGSPNGPFVRHGETRDLVGNTTGRLIGLALNRDGSLGLARGSEAFIFSRDLRLQGIIETESAAGGAAIHPDHPGVQRAFVSGVTAEGLSFIDVMDTFHFRRMGRIFVRDPVTGPIRAVRTPQGGLKVYAVTEGGIVAVDVLTNDL